MFRRQARAEGLRTGDNTVLTLGQVAQGRGELTLHAAQCDAPHRHSADARKIMEIPGFTENLVDDRPPHVPDSPDLPSYSCLVRLMERLGLSMLEGFSSWWGTRGE